MTKINWLNLQLFADGGEAAAEGTNTGDNAVGAADQRLRELGVPEDKLQKHRARRERSAKKSAPFDQAVPANAQEETKAAASTENSATPTEDKPTGRMSWDEIMKDPEYNKEMQSIVRSRLKTAGAAEEALGKLTPALELLARKYGLDTENIDHDALAKAIGDDGEYYEKKAMEMGVSIETAKKIDNESRENARTERAAAMTAQREMIENHFRKLEEQGEAMKKTFPSFDLQKELQNPVFARMTSPGGGISVEDAYYAVHRKEIQTASMQAVAEKTAQKVANSIRAGAKRPDENGISATSPSVPTFDYKHMSRDQRAAFKNDLKRRWANGEKVFPGQG